MKKIHKKVISIIFTIPLFLAITFCCCLDEEAFANEIHSGSSTKCHQESNELNKFDHPQHQHDSSGDHECSCSKHLSFLSVQSVDIVLDSTNQSLAKNFMANVHFENVALLALLSSQTHGPPFQDHLDHVSIPIYLKIRNLRL